MVFQRNRRKQRGHLTRAGLHLKFEALESRCVLSTFNLTPIVQASGPDPLVPSAPSGWPFTNTEAEPQLAVDPTNQNHLVGVWNQDGLGLVAGVSFNGGNRWQEVVVRDFNVGAGGAGSDPWVSFATNGDVYASYCGSDTVGNVTTAKVWVQKSSDGGLTWSAPNTLIATPLDQDKPTMTADPTNPQFVYATWVQLESNQFTTMFARTTDGGQTWEPARVIFDAGTHDFSKANQIVVLPNGTLVDFLCVARLRGNSGGINHFDFQLEAVRSTDHGSTWTSVRDASQVAELVPLLDSNTVPGARGVANPDGGVGVRAIAFMDIDVTVDPANGHLYAVWQDARFSNLQNYDIAFSMSSDGGLTWSMPIKVNQTPQNIPVGDRQAIIPSLAVNSEGVVAVTYYDFRYNTAAPGLLTDYWMVHAHPDTDLTNPTSWASENRLTDASFDMELAPVEPADGYFLGEYQGLSALGSHFGAFWAMPHQKQDGTIDQGSVFYRDPLTAVDGVDDGRSSIPATPPETFAAITRFDSSIADLFQKGTGMFSLLDNNPVQERMRAGLPLRTEFASVDHANMQGIRSAMEEMPLHFTPTSASDPTDGLELLDRLVPR